MRIALISHLKFPIAKPYCGGLEMFTHALAKCLSDRGHAVTLFASGDSDCSLNVRPVVSQSTVRAFADRPAAIRDELIDRFEDRAYRRLMRRLPREEFDVVHNNTLNPVVLKSVGYCGVPALTTLHVPPLPRLTAALRKSPSLRRQKYVTVSAANGKNWSRWLRPHDVVHNGVDTNLWRPRHTSAAGADLHAPRAVWTGRILPDKGTHFAIKAAHEAGLSIDLAGPVNDESYFREQVLPLLQEGDRYHGLLDHEELAGLVSSAAVSLCTPCWDEPFGLVVSEALACGTPVASFLRGGPAEIIDRRTGRLTPPGDVSALARGIRECLTLDPSDCRRRAVELFSIEAMVQRYEMVYESMLPAARHQMAEGSLYSADEAAAAIAS